MSEIMFEKLTRTKARFDSPQGQLMIEDLFDLPLTSINKKRANLDDIARALSKQVKEAETESFVETPAASDELTLLKFEAVKYVIKVIKTENEAKALAKANKEKKQLILGFIAQKENEAMAGKSVEELRSMIDAL